MRPCPALQGEQFPVFAHLRDKHRSVMEDFRASPGMRSRRRHTVGVPHLNSINITLILHVCVRDTDSS